MSKIRSREAKKLQQSLKAHNATKAIEHEAWQILHEKGMDEALEYIAEVTRPEQLLENSAPFEIWGAEQIDSASIAQMQAAARLPIARKGALMPDAHVGYGLPIGGVLATEGAVIPYAVGVDIACRMRLSIFDMEEKSLKKHNSKLKDALLEETRFGAGSNFEVGERWHHPVLDNPNWNATNLLKRLKDTAVAQLGTSGGGNHFVEWGSFTLETDDAGLGMKAGTYLALLSHSGSRGVGARIAEHYSELAMNLRPNLDSEVKHLAWLELESEAGQEYWLSMELAGEFAAANHTMIHERIAHATGFTVLASVENHHNFAWKELVDGKELIVHRKGATPAAEGVMGIIPGSMGDPGYLVRGKGNIASLKSASHGAGRKLSRRQAKKSLSRGEMQSYLKPRNIELIGGGVDEAPHAYKNIKRVMEAQTDLVNVVGEFLPRIVRMAGDGSHED